MISKTAPLFAYNYDFSERYKLNISLCNLCYNSLAMEFYQKTTGGKNHYEVTNQKTISECKNGQWPNQKMVSQSQIVVDKCDVPRSFGKKKRQIAMERDTEAGQI